MRAIGKNVVVKQFHEKSTSPSGLLYLPHAKDHAVMQGKVLSVGDEVENISAEDVVIYDQHAGMKITDEKGKELLVLSEDDVIARVEI